jgi:TRAP-type C4-dicarboxylate transport system substrate-binding protein
MAERTNRDASASTTRGIGVSRQCVATCRRWNRRVPDVPRNSDLRAATVRVLTLILALALAVPIAAKDVAAPVEVKLSTALGPAYAQGKAGEVWATLIRDRSVGRLAARHYPGAVLTQRDAVREFAALRDGSIDLAVGSTLVWSAQVPALNVLALPWLVPNDAALEALLAGDVGRHLTSSLEGAGVVPLASVANGFTALATRVAVRKPADVAGLKIRVPGSPLAIDMLAALDAQSTSMSAVDARVALGNGMLDGQETSIAAFAASRLDTAGLTHLLLWEARADALIFAVNRARWDAWSESDRALVRQAAQDAALEALAMVRRAGDAATLATLARQGVSITRLTPAGKGAFRAAVQPVFERWAAVAGWELVRAAETGGADATRKQ